MAVIGTFSQFTTARLALYASQASLSVTGNNISNINTPGYTRQRMDLVSLYSTGQGKYANIFNTNIGYGVLTNGASQLRDPYLDIRYRNENTKLAACDEKLDGLYQIGNILDEVGKGTGQLEGFGVIEAQFSVFFEQLDKGKMPNVGWEEYDDLVRSASTTLAAYFRKAASDLEDIKVNKANELNEGVNEVNKLLNQIRDLNAQIRTQNIYGDKALELRDARNLAIDELSGFMPIDVTYSMERIDQWTEVEKLTITIKNSQGPDGQPIKLVDGIYGGQITMPERMPEVNKNYDYKAFVEAVNKAKEEAAKAVLWDDANKTYNTQLWTTYPNLAVTQAQVDDAMAVAEQKVRDKAAAETPPPTTDELDAAVAAARKRAAIRLLEPGVINAAVKAAEDAQYAAGNGKYVVTKNPDGTVATATNDFDAAAAEANDNSFFNYNEKDMIDPKNLYLFRVEQLVDQRGRVMDDRNDPSGKSQAIALDDTTFCAKSADASADENRVDSNALGSLQAMREMLIRKGEYSSAADIERDNYATTKRGIQYYEYALDNLANKFAYIFNQANQMPLETVYGFDPAAVTGAAIADAEGNQLQFVKPDGTKVPLTWDMVVEEVPVRDFDGNPVQKTDANGTPLWEMEADGVTPKLDPDGNKIPVIAKQYQFKSSVEDDPNATPSDNTELKAVIEQVRNEAKKQPGYSYYNGGVLFSNRGDNNDPTGITAANISVSYSWTNHTVRMLPSREKWDVDGNGVETPHSSVNDNIGHMVNLFQTKWDYAAQKVKGDAAATLPVFHGTFQEVFTAIGATLGEDYNATNGKVENYSISTLSLDNDRLSVMGVDLNEEATSMMQFSKSYSAACRLLTTIDSMLDTLINGTAR